MDKDSEWAEFEATVSGDSILIPEIFREQCQGDMHITVYRVPKIEERKKAVFDAFRIDMKGFKFNREEANER